MSSQPAYLLSLLAFGYAVTACVLASLLAVRFASLRDFRSLAPLQYLALLLITMSLLFVVSSNILVLGQGAVFNHAACSAAVWLCILLYALSKLVLYLLLLERMWTVHNVSNVGYGKRFSSKWHRLGSLVVLGWIGVAVLTVPGRISSRRGGTCYIGLKLYTTIPLLIVDTIANVFLSVAFLWPIWRSNSPEVVRLARRSAIAAFIALLTSFLNGLFIVILHGQELSWVCLGSCGLDLTINAIIIFIVTLPAADRRIVYMRADDLVDPPARLPTGLRKNSASRHDFSSVAVRVTREVRIDEEEGESVRMHERSYVYLPDLPPRASSSKGRPRTAEDGLSKVGTDSE
ncbi:hypothetical protein JCM10908_003148 [Rhodotorula pacifica]|uniref:uncharacterized protein n=1 Tax=Rhodotorula pacifica TaxID=1495444 RepID=UPI00316EDDFD